MTFLHPWVLLLIAVPVLLLWTVLCRGAGIIVPFDHHAQAHPRRRWLRAIPIVTLAPASP